MNVYVKKKTVINCVKLYYNKYIIVYMEETFTNLYEGCGWGNNNMKEYAGSSGGGSTVWFNENTYVPFLKKFIINNNIKNVVDLGCGDFVCGPLIYDNLNIKYTGYDAYKKVIDYNSNKMDPIKYKFLHLDFCNKKEDIIDGELCILKDVLQHWSLKNIYNFLDYLVYNKKFKYILITNCANQIEDNNDIVDGKWRELNSKYFPLKKYQPIVLYKYHTKEVSLIKV